MKKLIVLLLAIAMVGAVSAQVTTAISLSGSVTLVDQAGKGVFTRNGNGYDLWTFRATSKDGKYGISLTDQNILDDGGFVVRDWNFWWTGKYTKVILGKLRNGDFRMTVPYWAGATIFGGTDRITDYGVLIETLPKNGLTFGVNLPYGTAVANTVDVLKKADFGVKYDVKGFGTFVALFNADLVTPANVLNAGIKYTGMKNLTAVGITRMAFDADKYYAALGFAYSGIDKLALNLEGAFKYDAGVQTFSVWGQGAYSLTDKMTATVGGSVANGGAYDAYANLGYNYGNGLSSEVGAGYNGALYGAAKLYYSVSF